MGTFGEQKLLYLPQKGRSNCLSELILYALPDDSLRISYLCSPFMHSLMSIWEMFKCAYFSCTP